MNTSGSARLTLPIEDRYAALQRIEGWQQDRLRSATVLVAGAGALGNEILKNLALLGVGQLIIVDMDHVELPNLARAVLFRPGDEGQPKAVVAANAVRGINPDVTSLPIHGDIGHDVGLGLFRRVDVVIGGLDNRQARVALNQRCWYTRRPWVDGALTAFAGLVRVFVPPDGACYECTLTDADYADMSRRYSCHGVMVEGLLEGKVPTTPTIASIIGAMQVQETVKLLHGDPVLAGHELIYHSTNHTLDIVRLPRRPDCLAHSTLGRVIEVPEFRAATTTAAELLDRACADLGPGAQLELDSDVAVDAHCPAGHAAHWLPRPLHRLREQDLFCPTCGLRCELIQSHVLDARTTALELPLQAWGVPPAHIVRARCAHQSAYYELTGDIAGLLPWIQPTTGATL